MSNLKQLHIDLDSGKVVARGPSVEPTGNDVKQAGDTMTGPLILSGDPIEPLQAVTKQYVDEQIVTGGIVFNQLSLSAAWTIPHNRNTTNLIIQVYVNNQVVIPTSVTIMDGDVVTVTLSVLSIGFATISFPDNQTVINSI